MNFYQINELSKKFRIDNGIHHDDSIDLFPTILNKIKNLTIVFLNMENEISGACYKFKSQKIIFINAAHSKGRQTFTAAHELYHLFYDDTPYTICNVNAKDEIEKQADYFASFLLLPITTLYHYKKEKKINKWDLDSIIQCEQYFQISHEVLLQRLEDSGEISAEEYEDYKPDIKINALKRGYDSSLYEPYISENYTIGNYVRLVDKAYDKKIISHGRKEEYLLDAFLSDLVYNLEDL